MTHMDDNTNLTPEQTNMQTGEEVSFTISGEDAEAQEALNAKKPQRKNLRCRGSSAAQPLWSPQRLC